MKPDEIDAILRQTMEDRRLSRGEKKALGEVIRDARATPEDLAFWRHRAFAVARDALQQPDARGILDWLEACNKALLPSVPSIPIAEVHISPGDACLGRIRSLIEAANHSLDICVFTITDDRITERILRAHRRGVNVRVITDDQKSLDRGSDIEELASMGVPVRTDQSPHHMHHKFALVDRQLLVNGSYNWTRSAADKNEENVIITDDPRLVGKFTDEFERLWIKFQ